MRFALFILEKIEKSSLWSLDQPGGTPHVMGLDAELLDLASIYV